MPAQPSAWTGRIIACESRGDVRYLACDATEAYRGAAQRVVRHLAMFGEEGLILLDDVAPAGGRATVTAQYQCGGATSAMHDSRTVFIQGQEARLRLDVLTHREMALECHPERTLHDTHWGYHFAQCRHFPATGQYQASGDEPLVTVFLDATTGDPGACSVSKDEREIIVRLPSGRQAAFVRLAGGWCLDLPPAATG